MEQRRTQREESAAKLRELEAAAAAVPLDDDDEDLNDDVKMDVDGGGDEGAVAVMAAAVALDVNAARGLVVVRNQAALDILAAWPYTSFNFVAQL